MAKKIVVIGDKMTDIYLLPNQSSEPLTRNMGRMQSSPSGVDMLTGFIEKMTMKPTLLGGNSEPLLTTISEMEEKEKRLYLKKQIGLFPNPKTKNDDTAEDNSDSLTTADLDSLQNSDIVAIYNTRDEATYAPQDQWEKLKNAENAKLILLRTLFEETKNNSVFLELINDSGLAAQTILIFNVDELRMRGFNIRKGVSWEQLSFQTAEAIKKIPNYESFKYILVCFDHEGCFVYSKRNGSSLFYYPDEIERDYAYAQNRRIFGSTITMQASLIYHFASATTNDAFETLKTGITRGLIAMRRLVIEGLFGKFESPHEQFEFPYGTISEVIMNEGENEKECVHHTFKALPDDDFTFVDEFDITDIKEKCKKYIKTGGVIGDSMPRLSYGDYLTYDKFEIEQLRTTYNLFRWYVDEQPMNKPLSICVFGPPGCGKSFAVKQIANTIAKENKRTLEFNLSQMKLGELISAFHQIRDIGIAGKLPIVFFDEFDSTLGEKKMGWLKYFLAPMQDGEFNDNGITHVIGRAIFIFAGGICESMTSFKNEIKNDSAIEKGIDFLSRIKGYINIAGPNKRTCSDGKLINDTRQCKNCGREKKGCHGDAFMLLRRTVLLRSILENKLKIKKGNIEIADDVFDAFMDVEKYVHGVRSLEAIVLTSDIVSGKLFTMACINKNYLGMYVDDSSLVYFQ